MEIIDSHSKLYVSEKPMNILMHIDKDLLNQLTKELSCDDDIFYDAIKQNLLKILGNERFTVYPITNVQITNHPWQHTAVCLICIYDNKKFVDLNDFTENYNEKITNFVRNNGKIIGIALNDLWNNLECKNELASLCNKDLIEKELIKIFGVTFLENFVHSEADDHKYTECYYFNPDGEELDKEFIHALNTNKNCPYHFITFHDFDRNTFDKSRIPIILDYDMHSFQSEFFNLNEYWQNLRTDKLGRKLIFTEIIDSTMNIMNYFSRINGAIAISSRQLKGKGRQNNTWISPKGSALFTLCYSTTSNSNLFRNIGFIQHILSLGTILAILNIPGYELLDLKLKWPNDIYWNSKVKLGGVLVTSKVEGKNVYFSFGIGMNIANDSPIISLNTIISSNTATAHLKPLTVSQVIARIMSELEPLILDLENGKFEQLKDLYYKYWLHSNQDVILANQEIVKILGIDSHGYLTVETKTQEICSLHPDGNRFDMLKNMIFAT